MKMLQLPDEIRSMNLSTEQLRESFLLESCLSRAASRSFTLTWTVRSLVERCRSTSLCSYHVPTNCAPRCFCSDVNWVCSTSEERVS